MPKVQTAAAPAAQIEANAANVETIAADVTAEVSAEVTAEVTAEVVPVAVVAEVAAIVAEVAATPIEEIADALGSADVRAERQRATDIIATCALAGRPDDAGDFIAKGKTLSEVVASLQDARASATASGAGCGSQIIARRGDHDGAPALRVDLAAEMRKRAGMKG